MDINNNGVLVDESQLEKMTIEELFKFRRQCANNRDLKSLLAIVEYLFNNSCAATNERNLPEICYYYARLNRVEELEDLLSEKEFSVFFSSEFCQELMQNLISIGQKFPYLNEEEILYLEEKYCDSKTFELFDILMFDCDRLPRPIKKFDKNTLNIKNSHFSKNFLIKVYNCFSKNEELYYDKLYIYSRIQNKIIRKSYEDIGLDEYCITQPIISNEFWSLMKEKYGEECADYFATELFKMEASYSENWEDFKECDQHQLNIENIEKVASVYFADLKNVENVKSEIALFWLNKVNNTDIELG